MPLMEYGYHRKTDFGVYEEMFMEIVGQSATDGCKGVVKVLPNTGLSR